MVNLKYDGILAFRSSYSENFSMKAIHYLGDVYLVPDWSQHHDSGDEDDGEHKATEKYLKEHYEKKRVTSVQPAKPPQTGVPSPVVPAPAPSAPIHIDPFASHIWKVKKL